MFQSTPKAMSEILENVVESLKFILKIAPEGSDLVNDKKDNAVKKLGQKIKHIGLSSDCNALLVLQLGKL